MSAEKDLLRASADHPSSEPHMSPKMRLNTEELRILQECNKESFYYRSVPLVIAAATATQIAVNRGLLKSHPRWGSTFKLLGASFVGWFIGKISYRSACEEKFLHLQNSQLGDLIRKKRGLSPATPKDGTSTNEILLLTDDAPSYSVDDDFTSSSRSLNLDTDKNIQYSGLDDHNRPTGSEYDTHSGDKQKKYSTTYEDLRRKNREEYELRQSKLYQPSSPSPSVPPSSFGPKDWRTLEDNKPPTRQSNYRPESSGMENVYGDRWDK